MNFRPFRHSIKYWKARIFKLASVEHPYSQQEVEQLAAEIIEYGRMRQEHHGSHSVLLSCGEMAMRLRETSNTIVRRSECLGIKAALKRLVRRVVGGALQLNHAGTC